MGMLNSSVRDLGLYALIFKTNLTILSQNFYELENQKFVLFEYIIKSKACLIVHNPLECDSTYEDWGWLRKDRNISKPEKP